MQALSAKTGAPVSSLIVSFGVLHELTAIVPLVGLFFGARALGVGERIVGAIRSDKDTWAGSHDSWIRMRCGEWVNEGEVWAEKVGRRYGVFGYEKRGVGEDPDHRRDAGKALAGDFSSRLAGDAANAIVAYGLTKVRNQYRISLTVFTDFCTRPCYPHE